MRGIFCGQAPLQKAMAFALDFPDSYYVQFLTDYTRRNNRSQGRYLVRFCFCKRKGTLEKAIPGLKRWLKQDRKGSSGR